MSEREIEITVEVRKRSSDGHIERGLGEGEKEEDGESG